MKTSNKFVDLKNSRGGTQDEVMKLIIKRGEDPFSVENLKKYHKEPILFETDHWLITKSQWPYKNTEKHILLISKRYIEKPTQLSNEEKLDLFECLRLSEEKLGVVGGGFCMRFGDTSLSGATVKHLHAHIIVPDLNSTSYDKERVQFFVGGNK
jgi:diadenosine tetraphosphate (Ap4A) HIT family hydrolase